MKKYLHHRMEFLVGIGIWIVSAVIYLITMARTVQFIDSGELAAAACTLGIAHPTGYPLFTIIARIFSEIPTAGEEIVRLNIMSVLFVTIAVVLFYNIMLQFLNDQKRETKITAAVFSSFAFAFSETVWNQATAVEVYSLHLVMICLVLLVLFTAISKNEFRWWMLFAFLFGLAFTNHMTTILLIPAVVFIYFKKHGFGKHSWKKIGVLSLPFSIGLSVYLFLFVRSASQPILNWGNPSSLEKLLWHVSGKQFRVWMFSSTEVANRQLKYFFNNLPQEFFYVSLLLAAAGFFYLLFYNREKFVFILLLFISCVAYSINYDIHDIDSYFLLAFAAVSFCIGFGIVSILSMIKKYSSIIVALLLLSTVIQISRIWENTDERSNGIVEDYALNILNNLPKNSIVISYQWDYFIAASYYFQHVKNIRPDVVVIDKELLRRSWYFEQLKNLYPALTKKSEKEIQNFLVELFKFEHNLPYDFYAIEGSYTAMIKSFIDNSIDSTRIFVGREVEQNYTNGYNRVPNGLLYELRKDTAYVPTNFSELSIRSKKKEDSYTTQLKRIIATCLADRSLYEKTHQRDSSSVYFQQKAQLFIK